ncbi:DUF1775 domain-containing protein [Bacillus sp. FJAT-49736]|uniref:YcnI family copper-binding membrane protein n=1 Tax=Bacillus sp. FJAT-49736 TaxID=2833582 RepID=UPI001BC989BA|nr:DUF1775 domain-containing protein [Bacillus sp. FJAT-49736]MBS4174938.1 DUF1775 domain-containing protein [Bacillus sp. FJAT-49736]
MKKLIGKISKIAVPTIAGLFLFAGIASAHVTVKPNVSAPGAWETYTIKIPVEKEVPTTKVTLKIPNGVEFEQYQPTPDWKVTTKKDSSGKVTIITWEATGEGIQPGQFQQFNFVAKNPDKEGTAAWDAFQYYKDGSIVEWTGDEKSDTPHSITNITTSNANVTQPAAHSHQADEKVSTEKPAAKTKDSTAFTLSIVALVLAILAFVNSARKKK